MQSKYVSLRLSARASMGTSSVTKEEMLSPDTAEPYEDMV
jgi:hypothetical protein